MHFLCLIFPNSLNTDTLSHISSMWEKENAAPGIGNWTDTFKASMLGYSHGCRCKTNNLTEHQHQTKSLWSCWGETTDKVTLQSCLNTDTNKVTLQTTKIPNFLLFQLVKLLLLYQLQIWPCHFPPFFYISGIIIPNLKITPTSWQHPKQIESPFHWTLPANHLIQSQILYVLLNTVIEMNHSSPRCVFPFIAMSNKNFLAVFSLETID